MGKPFEMLVAAVLMSCRLLGGDAARTPVLVELFTSEGCSSCPPADAFLERLDRLQPVPGAQVIVLSEHVDYWNHDGWSDPFSSPDFTLRQQAYNLRLKLAGPYTPQMVVNGDRQCVGNDDDAARAAIAEASREPKLAVRIAAGARPDSVSIEIDGPAIARAGDVFLAYAEDEGATDVTGGENLGHRLHYVAIVTKLQRLGKLGRSSTFHAEVKGAALHGKRLIAFVQEPDTGHVLGAAMLSLTK